MVGHKKFSDPGSLNGHTVSGQKSVVSISIKNWFSKSQCESKRIILIPKSNFCQKNTFRTFCSLSLAALDIESLCSNIKVHNLFLGAHFFGTLSSLSLGLALEKNPEN